MIGQGSGGGGGGVGGQTQTTTTKTSSSLLKENNDNNCFVMSDATSGPAATGGGGVGLGFPPRAAANNSGGARGRLVQGPQLHKVAPMQLNQENKQQSSLLVDKSTLKVNLPNGGFNLVKFGDATDIKVRLTRARPWETV